MNSKHLGELKTFFRKNNKEIRKQLALKGNSPKKILKLVIKDNAYALVDPITKNEGEVQPRVSTYDVYEELRRIEEEQHHLSHDLLHRKYAFLFEYKSFLSIKIFPKLGLNKLIIRLSKVVLPDPVFPIIPIFSPFIIEKDIFLRFIALLWGYL